jgi:putative endonuclease
MSKSETKKTNHQTGLIAESLCRLSLRLRFYRILASRYRSHYGEIDIVAARGKNLAFIEVKARPTQTEALESITRHQRERLQRTATDYLAKHPYFRNYNARFDVMLVTPWRWPVHLIDAWRI